MTITMTPIGHVQSERTEPLDDDWDAVKSHIVLDADQYAPESLAGLATFSHVEVFFVFDQVRDEKIVTGARHPRGRTDWPKVGIFAQRGKNRPNRLGATICKIDRVDGLTVYLTGLDAIHGSPVLDIKPVMTEFLPRGPVHEPKWVSEVMADYWRTSDTS